MSAYKFIPYDDYNVGNRCYDDIVKQNIDAVYSIKSVKLPIESHIRFSDIGVPEQYIRYLKKVKSVLAPNPNISSGGLGVALCEAFRDFTAGTHVKLSKDGESVQDFDSIQLINKALLAAEMYGTSIIISDYSKPLDENGNPQLMILNSTEFFYNETKNRLNYCYNTYYNGEDADVSGYRYINRSGELVIVEQYHANREKLGVISYRVPAKTLDAEGLEMYSFTHNPTGTGFYGISALHDVLTEVQTIELINHEYTKAMYYTKPRALINNEAITLDENGEPTVDLANDIYIEFDSYASDGNKVIETISFNFDANGMSQILKDKLSSVLTKLGLDSRVLAFEGSKIERSATEIMSNEDRMTATINNRRTEYANQILKMIRYIDPELDLDFIPMRLLRFDSVVTNVVQLKNVGLISTEMSLKMLHPYLSDSEIQDELNRLNGESLTVETTDSTVEDTTDEIIK